MGGLIRQGLTLQSSSHGSFFYLIIGTHGLHAVAALVFLGLTWWGAKKGRFNASLFYASEVFWYFVVGVWPLCTGSCISSMNTVFHPFVRGVAPAVPVVAPMCAHSSDACPGCIEANEANREAFLFTTGLLTLIPLIVIGCIVRVPAIESKRHREEQSELASLRESPDLQS